MILHRLLGPDDDLGVCRIPIQANVWIGSVDGARYIKANQGGIVSSDRCTFTGWLVGIRKDHWNGSQAVVDVFEKTRSYLAESTPELDGTTVIGPVIETSSHRYMLCVPCKIVEQGSLMVHGWIFPEAT